MPAWIGLTGKSCVNCTCWDRGATDSIIKVSRRILRLVYSLYSIEMKGKMVDNNNKDHTIQGVKHHNRESFDLVN